METLQDENIRLQQELQQRDLLVQQLSEEVLRLVKGNIAFLPNQAVSEKHEVEIRTLTTKLANSEEQLILYELLLKERDQQLDELRQALVEIRTLTTKLANSEEQLILYELLLKERDQQLDELRQALDEATTTAQNLQQKINNLPNVYSTKFSERMEPVKTKVEELQKQNTQLNSEVQNLSHRLAHNTVPLQRIEVPEIQTAGLSLPTFSDD